MNKFFNRHKVILKMDDLSEINPNVRKLDKIVDKEKIKVTWGVIGADLNIMPDDDVKWIIEKQKSGYYQFWNHGYTHSMNPCEFKGATIDEQRDSLKRTQDLGKSKLGITFTAFGSPGNAIDENSAKALDFFPEITTWFFGLPDCNEKNILEQNMVLESRVGHVDFKNLKYNFEKNDSNTDIITLQGHPNLWNRSNFLEFIKIVKYLKKQGCTFVLPEEIFETKHLNAAIS